MSEERLNNANRFAAATSCLVTRGAGLQVKPQLSAVSGRLGPSRAQPTLCTSSLG